MSWDSRARRGWCAERLAAAELERCGYRVVRFNFRASGAGEIDIVAFDGPTLCFVEVRCRKSAAFGHPLETIDRRKRRRLLAGARQYLAQQAEPQPAVRFDVVSVVLWPELECCVVQGAFDETGLGS